jgi:hypothetical protein
VICPLFCFNSKRRADISEGKTDTNPENLPKSEIFVLDKRKKSL